eukprot:887088-Alexandrium_andersonii.AAC.1
MCIRDRSCCARHSKEPSRGGYCPPGPPRLAPPARAASPGGPPPSRTPPIGASGAPEAPASRG